MHESDDSTSTATLLGFLLREGPTPGILLETGPGMTVLYGLNGAGKSRILNDVRHFFSGISSDAIALVALPPSPRGIDWFHEMEASDWYPDWARRGGITTGDGDHVDVLRSWAKACLSAEDVILPGVPGTSSLHRVDRLDALIREWLDQPLILIKAQGSEHRRSWASAPAFLTGQATPRANDEVELFEIYANLDQGFDGFTQIALTPYGTTDAGQTIACASNSGQSVLEDDAIPFSAGIHDRLIDMTPTLAASFDDLDAQTRVHLFDRVSSTVDIVAGHPQPSIALVSRVENLVALANTHFLKVLQDAPHLRLHVDPVGLGQQVQWYVAEDDGWEAAAFAEERGSVNSEWLESVRTLTGLSSAQLRWASWSIQLALDLASGAEPELPEQSMGRLFLLDEPEAALHRSAEAHMAEYFTNLASNPNSHMVVATHSPELLETSEARVYEVSRSANGLRLLKKLSSANRENMTSLGLQPSDLLRRQRGFILVEGVHDEVVLEELFGDLMRTHRIEVLPLRGTSELSPAKISFLFDYTPAHVLVMLDNVQSEELSVLWEQARSYMHGSKPNEAEALVSGAACLTETDEGRKLKKVLLEALLNHRAHRITPYGLSCQDIVEYLPASVLVPTGMTWVELRRLHEVRKAAKNGAPKDFKKWLAAEHKASFEVQAIRAATRSLDAVPADLLRLWKTIEARLSK